MKKRGGLTLEFCLFEYLNYPDVIFGMSHANSIDFNIGVSIM